ncbi:MAG: NAD(P)/FAD-dependent oxidoreductase [Vicinamibacterales bacterium]
MSPQPDVLIVGAGPAGSVAALILARAGARVRLVDRARFPREKLCGDTLNPGALARLDRLGIAGSIRRHALSVTGMIVTGPDATRVVGEYEHGVRGAAIARRDLDLALLEAATQAGAEFDADVVVRAPRMAPDGRRLVGVRVAAGTGEHDLHARLVIAADGRHSRLAFGLGLASYASRPRRWAFGTYYAGVEGLTTCGEMHIRSDGYVGVAPVPGGLTNVCVVRELGSAFRAHRIDADTLVDRAVMRDPLLCDRFARARRASPVTVLGPLAVEARSAGLPGLLLAGDAAGFIDPMTGDGLHFAIRGAELAAQHAASEIATGRAAYAELAAARRREFAAKWRLNRLLRALVASPRGVRVAALVAAVWNRPVRALIAMAGDVSTPRSAVRDPHSAIGTPHSALRDPRSARSATRGDREPAP